MINKTIMIGLIAIAFVAGSITTGSIAYGAAGGTGDNLIVDALNNIATAISGIEPNVQVDVPPAEIQVIGVEGPQGPKGDQGDKGDKGDTGEQGPPGENTGLQEISVRTIHTSKIMSSGATSLPVSCDADEVVVNQGYGLQHTDLKLHGYRLTNEGKTVTFYASMPPDTSGLLEVDVLCMKLTNSP